MALQGTVVRVDSDGCEIYTVQGPDAMRERLILLNTEGRVQLGERFGSVPGRASVSRWRIDGYPIDRNGPRVLMPYTVRLKRVYTSTPALVRWFRLIQELGEEIRNAGGVRPWREERKKHGEGNRDEDARVGTPGFAVRPDQPGEGGREEGAQDW